MKTKKEFMGNLITYPFIAVFLLVVLFAFVLIAPVVVAFVVLTAVIVLAYASVFLLNEAIWKCINYLFVVQRENIEGDVIAMKEKVEQLVVGTTNSNNGDIYTISSQTIDITNYFLKIKKGMQWYTVKVPKYVFQKIKGQVKAGIRTINLSCEKHGYNDFYELSSNQNS